MLPIVTDGTASMCDCAADGIACDALAATITLVTTAALIVPIAFANGSLVPRLKCKSCSHICRSIRLANVSRAFPQNPKSHTLSSKMPATKTAPGPRCGNGFHIPAPIGLHRAPMTVPQRHVSSDSTHEPD